jgi:hypothetical protein
MSRELGWEPGKGNVFAFDLFCFFHLLGRWGYRGSIVRGPWDKDVPST